MNLKAREMREPDVAIARQRAENDLADLTRTRIERLAGLERLTLAKHGPVRHVATALVLPSTRSVEEQIGAALDDLDPKYAACLKLPPRMWSLRTNRAGGSSASVWDI